MMPMLLDAGKRFLSIVCSLGLSGLVDGRCLTGA